MTIVIHCTQGDQTWHRARAGVITASMFRVARSRYVRNGDGYRAGDFKAEASDYAFQLAIERISGEPLDESFETWQMRRGHELEPEARREHEIQTGEVVYPCGFITTDDGVFGASADGLISEDGGAEYKCLVSPLELRKVLIDGDFSKYTDQVQGCLWLSGRRWWDFCLYCPALRPIGRQLWRRRVFRDEAYIEPLEADLVAFMRHVAGFEATLRMGVEQEERERDVA